MWPTWVPAQDFPAKNLNQVQQMNSGGVSSMSAVTNQNVAFTIKVQLWKLQGAVFL